MITTDTTATSPVHDFSRCHVGILGELDATAVAKLVEQYEAHARFEEAEYLPLAYTVLSRKANQMDALALALHLRHAPNVVGYV